MDFPSITEETRSELDNAIHNMKGSKAAGPDGLPIDIYKEFKDKLLDLLY